jgi:C1A family cysteine protease
MAVKRGKTKQGPGPEYSVQNGTPTVRKIARYGWIPDLPDQRDFTYAVPAHVMAAFPSSVDLRDRCPTTVYDQGQLGSCTANAIAGALEFDMMRQALAAFTPSRLFIYYNERVIEGTVGHDAGALIRDGIKSVARQGACQEGNPGDAPPAWPYDITKYTVRPAQPCYADAKKHKAISYLSLTQNLADLKGCLAEGFPFIFGFSVYESFESQEVANTGNVPMPGPEEQLMGGHAVLAVGHDDQEQVFIVRNSWGPGWGDAGYFYMPYAYLIDDNLADDFWTVRLVI